MAIQNTLQNAVQQRLPKMIDARTHGIIDYAHASFFLGAALLLRKSNPRAALACLTTGTLVLGQSLLTDYPLGAEPVISFQTHGRLDTGFAAISGWIPRVFGFSDTAAANIFRANAFVETVVVGMTDFQSAAKIDPEISELIDTGENELGHGRVAA